MASEQRNAAWLRLALTRGLGPTLIRRLIEATGGPNEATAATVGQLKQIEGIGLKQAEPIRRAMDDAEVDREQTLMAEHGVTLLTLDDPDYPLALKHIYDPPPVLYLRGEVQREDGLGLAIVGSRKCTGYGREQADRFAAGCAQAGLTIISGGARGIDSAAHQAALRINGRTLAVLGCGLSRTYPPENAPLFDRIAGQGAVLSEFPMTTPPNAENFPRRNRVISGLALGVLVIEAANRSGALITARLAAEEHGREAMAVPGRVDSPMSRGCHAAIRAGWAALVTNAADVLDCLGDAGRTLKQQVTATGLFDEPDDGKDGQATSVAEAGLTEEQTKILEVIGTEPVHVDIVTQRSGLPINVVQSQLTLFQLRGLVESVGGSRVRRK